MGLLYRGLSVTTTVLWSLTPQNLTLMENLLTLKISTAPCIQSVRVTHLQWLQIVRASAWKQALFGQKMLKHILMKKGQIDWITYILQNSELRPGLGLFTFGYPPSTRGLSSACKYSSLSSLWQDLLLNKRQNIIFTCSVQHAPGVHLIYQSWPVFNSLM